MPVHRHNAQVAKLVDALCSGRSVRKDVMVRIHSWAPGQPCNLVLFADLQGFSFFSHPHFHPFSRFLPAILANFWLTYGLEAIC